MHVYSLRQTCTWLVTTRAFSQKFYGHEICKETHTPQKQVSKLYNMNNSDQTHRDQSIDTYLSYPEIDEDDPRFCHAIEIARAIKNPDDASRSILLESPKLISEALSSPIIPKSLFFSSRSYIKNLKIDKFLDVFYVPHKVLKRWSSLTTSPGLIALFEFPKTMEFANMRSHDNWRQLPVTLIIDQIRDPGNMGSLLRTASGFGLRQILTTNGSVDIWNEKVIRAGMSAHFFIPIYQHLSWERISNMLLKDSSSSTNYPTILPSIHVTGPHLLTESSINNGSLNSCRDHLHSLSTKPHFLVNHFPQPVSNDDQHSTPSIAIVAGSEANGASPDACRLARETNGSRLTIPCNPSMQSFNVVSAISVILGEMQRQYFNSFNLYTSTK